MEVTEIGVILEIAGHPNGKDFPRYQVAIDTIKQSAIGKHSVLAVGTLANEDPCHVPGFDHNYKCKNGKCVCNVQPYGVLRYFGVHIWIEGKPDINDLQTYRLTEHARLVVCGMNTAYEPGKNPLRVV